MIQANTPFLNDVKEFQKAQKERIFNSFKESETEEFVKAISKKDFQENYPAEKFEHYTIESLNTFRQELVKAEGDSSDLSFKAATKDLKGFVVHNEGSKHIVFVRQKEVGE